MDDVHKRLREKLGWLFVPAGGGDFHCFQPNNSEGFTPVAVGWLESYDDNFIMEVLRGLTEKQQDEVVDVVAEAAPPSIQMRSGVIPHGRWLLTAPKEVLAEAIIKVLDREGKSE